MPQGKYTKQRIPEKTSSRMTNLITAQALLQQCKALMSEETVVTHH